MSMFAKAKPISEAAPTKKANKKAEFPVESLQKFARVTAAIKSLETIAKTLDKLVKESAFDQFVKLASRTGIRPENFRGVEGDATGSMELRTRSSASVLTDEEAGLFDQAGIPYKRMVVIQHMFGINPKYTSDKTLLAKVEKALTKIVPDDFIVVQEEQSKNVVSDDSIDTVFKNLHVKYEAMQAAKADLEKNNTPATASEMSKAQIEYEYAKTLLRMVTTQATKPTTTEDLSRIMVEVVPMMLPTPVEVTVKVKK